MFIGFPSSCILATQTISISLMSFTSPLTTYEQALDFLYNRINYERVQSSAYSAGDFKLNRMRGLLELIGNPHERIPVVHIAGTKGKGSTAVMVASILQAAGYRTGLFTSPHLTRFEERMAVDGQLPSALEVVNLVNELLDPVARLDQELGGMNPTYFEITTAMAWLFFLHQQCDIVVLEVGLGGRLDATNVCQPEVCVITTISRDHTHLLGSDVQQIAREKGGIIKPHIPVVSGVCQPPAKEVIEQICLERSAPLRQLGCHFDYQFDPPQSLVNVADVGGNFSPRRTVSFRFPGQSDWQEELQKVDLPLLGEHQAHNASLAIRTVLELASRNWDILPKHVCTGLQLVSWPARIEILDRAPLTIVDAAHNWASISALIQTLDLEFPSRYRILVFAATQDKDVQGMLRQLLEHFDTIILTCYQSNPRGVPVEELLKLVRVVSARTVHISKTPLAALRMAQQLAGPSDLICITGSFFVAAEVREVLGR